MKVLSKELEKKKYDTLMLGLLSPLIENRNWPSNIRELQNVLEYALITTIHDAVSFQYLLEQEPSQTI